MTGNNTPQTTVAQGFKNLRKLLIDPHVSIQEIAQRRRAQLLAVLTLILFVVSCGALLSKVETYNNSIALLVFAVVAYGLSRTSFYRIGAYFFCFGFTAFAYLALLMGTASSYTSAITTSVPVSLVVASILLSPSSFTALLLFVVIASFSAPYYSSVPIPMDSNFYKETGVTIAMGVVLVGTSLFRSFVEKERLEELNRANQKLEDIASTLEQRVEERTAAIEQGNKQISRHVLQLRAITELSESIAQLQDLNEFFPATTRLISERFGFYHVGVFLVDQDREYAILQAANSEGGERMLKRGHRLKLGVGVVGFAARTGKPRIALDVGADAVYFNNPDLPDTRSEVALPLRSRGETIGVLDVQSTEAGAFSSEDLEVLTALANQVSVALENARLLTEARAAYMQVQEVYNEFTRAEWSRTISQAEQPGFRYQGGRIEMLEHMLQNAEVRSAVEKGKIVTNPADPSRTANATLAVPVKLRGEVIGVLHIESGDPDKEWQADELSLVQAVAERAAFAMENARLFQDARRRAAKERLISEATSRISSAFDVENILQTTAEELERVLGGSEILIQFQSKE